MIMSWIWAILLLLSVVCSVPTGTSGAVAAAIPQGAQAGITLAISIAGSLCLWSDRQIIPFASPRTASVIPQHPIRSAADAAFECQHLRQFSWFGQCCHAYGDPGSPAAQGSFHAANRHG